jgi:GntR family transcriptional regulator
MMRLGTSSATHALDHSTLVVDRSSPVPLYFQIYELLEQAIVSGGAKPGVRISAEPELARHFGVSRSVVRQALARLENGGLVSRHRGHGSFVADHHRRSWRLEGSAGFFEDELRRFGRRVLSHVMRCELTPLPMWASDALGVAPATSGVILERVRYVDGLLTLYDINYLPERLSAGVLGIAGDEQQSLYGMLERVYGLRVQTGTRVVNAVIAGEGFADILDVAPGAPLLVVDGVDFDANSNPFDCYRTWLRPDRMKLEVEVQPR